MENKRLSLEEFLKRDDQKVISQVWHEEEETAVNISFMTIETVPNNEWLRFDFENPVYLGVDKIYCNSVGELMVIAGPFIYIDYSKSIATAKEDSADGVFYISKAYKVECDECNSEVNMITTNTKQFYCDECYNKLADSDNMIGDTIIVLTHKLQKIQCQ